MKSFRSTDRTEAEQWFGEKIDQTNSYLLQISEVRQCPDCGYFFAFDPLELALGQIQEGDLSDLVLEDPDSMYGPIHERCWDCSISKARKDFDL